MRQSGLPRKGNKGVLPSNNRHGHDIPHERKKPEALVTFWSTAPVPVVVALPAPLPKVIVSKPVFGLFVPVNELVGLPANLTNVLLLLIATLKESGDNRVPLEMSSRPDGRSIAETCAGGLVQAEPCTETRLVKPFV